MSTSSMHSLLKKLVAKVCEPYATMPQTKAILSIGSVSYGIVDDSSDIDLALYYDELPSDDQLRDAMIANGAEKLNWQLGSREDGGLIDSYTVHGVECQFAHTTLASMDRDMDSILVGLDVDSPFQKALSGVMAGIPIMGSGLIGQYQARAANYPSELRLAMVKRFLNFQPLWAIESRMADRDAELWRRQALVEGAFNLLGVLAGLNRLYFSTFQFKRMGEFIDHMEFKPDLLSDRIAVVFGGNQGASQEYRSLVAEAVALVEEHLPEIDTSSVHARLNRTVHRWNPETVRAALTN